MNLNEQKYLEQNPGKTYIHHPRWFRFSDGSKYMPDFYHEATDTYIEVAGTRQAYHANKHKYERMAVEFPEVRFEIVRQYEPQRRTPHGILNATAQKHKVTPVFVSYLLHGHRTTLDIDLAKDLAAISGKDIRDFLSPKIRGLCDSIMAGTLS